MRIKFKDAFPDGIHPATFRLLGNIAASVTQLYSASFRGMGLCERWKTDMFEGIFNGGPGARPKNYGLASLISVL